MSYSSNSSLSDSSDLSDSEIEFELYSQLHYSAVETSKHSSKEISASQKVYAKKFNGKLSTSKNCTHGVSESSSNRFSAAVAAKQATLENGRRSSPSPSFISVYSSDDEDWQIITSSSDSDDSDNRLGEGDDDLWKVSSVDHEKMNDRILRYYNKPKVRCFRCNAQGHMTYECSQPRKVQRCCLCGNKGHHSRACRASLYLGPCYKENRHCKRCDQIGHNRKHCPDIWRQFHLTVSPGRVQRSKFPDKGVVIKTCYYCFQTGHLPHECEERWDHDNQSFISPTIAKYSKKIKVVKTPNPTFCPTSLSTPENDNPKLKSEEKNRNVSESKKDSLPATKKQKKKVGKKAVPRDVQLSFKGVETKLQRLNNKRKNRAFEKIAKRSKVTESLETKEVEDQNVLQVQEVQTPFSFNFSVDSEKKSSHTGNEVCRTKSALEELQNETTQSAKVQNETSQSAEPVTKAAVIESHPLNDIEGRSKAVSLIDSSTCKALSNKKLSKAENLFFNSKSEKKRKRLLNFKKKNAANKVDNSFEKDFTKTPFPRNNSVVTNKNTLSQASLLTAGTDVTTKNQNLNSKIYSKLKQNPELTLPCA